MKMVLSLIISLVASNAFAISFITEEEVQATLGADKVIEVSKVAVQDKLVEAGSPCESVLFSRSSRTYVVKMGNQSFLYATPSDLTGLTQCLKL